MEIEEVKKITRYDEYTVNEFVRGLVKTRSDVEKANEKLAIRADNVRMKADELKVEMSEEELIKSEEELQSIKQEKEKIEQTLAEWENEKDRIKDELENKKQENENKIKENEEKIQNLENEVKENKEKMADLEKNSDEYKEFARVNKSLRGSILSLKKKNKKLNQEKDETSKILDNLENDIVEEKEFTEEKLISEGTPKTSKKSNNKKEKTYSEMTDKELKRKQRELFAQIVEGDDIYYRTHQENGMNGYEEDWLDKELKAVREELEKREKDNQKQKPEQKIQPQQKTKGETTPTTQETKTQPETRKTATEKVEKTISENNPDEQTKDKNEHKTKPYSEMTIDELKKRQRELFAQIVEGDDIHYRTHQENGMNGYEEDWLDKELKAVREELERRNNIKQEETKEEEKNPEVPKVAKAEGAQRVSFFARIKNAFTNFISRFRTRNQKALPAPENRTSNTREKATGQKGDTSFVEKRKVDEKKVIKKVQEANEAPLEVALSGEEKPTNLGREHG